MSRLRILVAEDEPLASMALRAQLEALGQEVAIAARDGDEAVALGRCLPVDLALFDMRMPGRDGLDAAAELFRHAMVPTILLTGFSGADLPDPIPRPPIFATLTKPVGLDELGGALHRALRRFGDWIAANEAEDRRDQSLHDRDLIARVIEGADEKSTKQAAQQLVERARSHGTPLVDLARQLLEQHR